MLCKHARLLDEQISRAGCADASLTSHLAQCESCRTFFEERSSVREAIDRLRSATSDLGPSRRVEQHVLAALNGEDLRSPAAWKMSRWLLGGALTAVFLFAVALFATIRRSAPPVAVVEERFTAMPYVVPPAPYERTSVVRTEVPLQVMLTAGFQVQGEDLGSNVLADVLFGEDGRILALRLVSQPNSGSNTRMD